MQGPRRRMPTDAEHVPSARIRVILLDVARTRTRLALEAEQLAQGIDRQRGLPRPLRQMHQGEASSVRPAATRFRQLVYRRCDQTQTLTASSATRGDLATVH